MNGNRASNSFSFTEAYTTQGESRSCVLYLLVVSPWISAATVAALRHEYQTSLRRAREAAVHCQDTQQTESEKAVVAQLECLVASVQARDMT